MLADMIEAAAARRVLKARGVPYDEVKHPRDPLGRWILATRVRGGGGGSFEVRRTAELTDVEEVALYGWSLSSGFRVNEYLRHGRSAQDPSGGWSGERGAGTYRQMVRGLDSAIGKGRITSTIVGRRGGPDPRTIGVRGGSVFDAGRVERYAEATRGRLRASDFQGFEFEDGGYIAVDTTQSRRMNSFGDMPWELTIPAGTHAAAVREGNPDVSPGELVLARGHRIRIDRIRGGVVYATVLVESAAAQRVLKARGVPFDGAKHPQDTIRKAFEEAQHPRDPLGRWTFLQMRGSIDRYMHGGTQHGMNASLRRGREPSKEAQKLTTAIEVLGRRPPGTLHRRIDSKLAPDLARQLRVPGAEVTDRGIMSTAVDPSGAKNHGDVHIVLTPKRGVRALKLAEVVEPRIPTDKSEHLLPPGSRIKVKEVRGRTVHADLLPPRKQADPAEALRAAQKRNDDTFKRFMEGRTSRAAATRAARALEEAQATFDLSQDR